MRWSWPGKVRAPRSSPRGRGDVARPDRIDAADIDAPPALVESPPDRVVTLTDGVIAIALTLLVLDLTSIEEMQHAEFPSCLRFSFTRNKLEKSRKPSSSACACLCHDWNGNRGNPCQS